MKQAPAIYPVILPVPPAARPLPPPERVRRLSRRAREALRLSAERLGVRLGPLAKDDRGAPLPAGGHHWSLTHKPAYVAAVVAPAAVGIDLEAIRAVAPGLHRKTADPVEWALAGDADRNLAFFRFWTAKEAVLKTRGEGMRDLGRCRVAAVRDEAHLDIDYAGEAWPVEHYFFDGHIASLAVRGHAVRWLLMA